VNALLQATWFTKESDTYEAEIGRMVDKLALTHLMKLAMNQDDKAHYSHGLFLIEQFKNDPEDWMNSQPVEMPDGSPIGMEAMGCGEHCNE